MSSGVGGGAFDIFRIDLSGFASLLDGDRFNSLAPGELNSPGREILWYRGCGEKSTRRETPVSCEDEGVM